MAQVIQLSGGTDVLIERIALRMKNLLAELPRGERIREMNAMANRLEAEGFFLGAMPERPTPEEFVQVVIRDNPNLRSSLRSQIREWNPLASGERPDSVYLGYSTWREESASALQVSGDPKIGVRIDRWLRLDQVVGRDRPIVPSSAPSPLP